MTRASRKTPSIDDLLRRELRGALPVATESQIDALLADAKSRGAALGATPDAMTLDDLRTASARVTHARDNLTAAELARDEVVRALLEAGARVVDVCDASGLSRRRVYQIKEGTR